MKCKYYYLRMLRHFWEYLFSRVQRDFWHKRNFGGIPWLGRLQIASSYIVHSYNNVRFMTQDTNQGRTNFKHPLSLPPLESRNWHLSPPFLKFYDLGYYFKKRKETSPKSKDSFLDLQRLIFQDQEASHFQSFLSTFLLSNFLIKVQRTFMDPSF